METDNIKEIRIDNSGRLCIFPENQKFTMIFTLAKEVHWDNDQYFLYSPKLKEWSYFEWYKHIIGVVKECNVTLVMTKETIWTNIPQSLKKDILET